MSTLPTVLCPSGEWTDISGAMVIGISYLIMSNGNDPYWLSEKATEPLVTDSKFYIKDREQQQVLFSGDGFWVQPIDGDDVVIEIQEAP
jgi:hypothetical protein